MFNKRHLITALLLFSGIFNLVLLVQISSEQDKIVEANIFAEQTLNQLNTANVIIEQDAARMRGLEAQISELEARIEELTTENTYLTEALSLHQDSFVVESPAPPRYIDCPLDEDLQDYIWVLCNYYGIADKYELIYAMIKLESNFNATIKSSTDDYGLMQINKCNHSFLHKQLGITDILNPYDNVHAGIYFISGMLHKYDVADALMAYNLGEGGASKLWRANIHSTAYSKQVLAYYAEITGNI